MKTLKYISEDQVSRFESENLNYRESVYECACGDCVAYRQKDVDGAINTNGEVVIVCDSCYENATNKERWY